MAKRDVIDYRKSGENTWEITDIAVHSRRRRGRGTQMVLDAIEDIKTQGGTRIFAIARDSNEIASKFYQSMDMKPQRLKDFYDEEDAIMYFKRI